MKRRDEYADLNRSRKRSGMMVFTIAVLAVCISGVLCARKLQQEQKYISLNMGDASGAVSTTILPGCWTP